MRVSMATNIPDSPISSPAAWLGVEQAKQTDWIYVRFDAEKVELDTAIRTHRRAGQALTGAMKIARSSGSAMPRLDHDLRVAFGRAKVLKGLGDAFDSDLARDQRCNREILVARECAVCGQHLRHVTDASAHLARLCDDVEACYPCGSRRRRQERRQHLDESTLAGAVRADEAEDFARQDT